MSYFPNWKVERRRGPVSRRAELHGGRADSTDVHLHYERSPLD